MAAEDTKFRPAFLRITQEASRSLFSELGTHLHMVTSLDASAAPILFGGVISFLGKAVRGSLTLGSSNELLAATNPVGKAADRREWLAELTNQLMGRIKNQLLAYAVEVTFGTPMTLRGEHFAELSKRKEAPLAFRAGPASMQVWLDVHFGRTFEMLERPDPKLGGPGQGGIVLF
jgi:hypothetical protein